MLQDLHATCMQNPVESSFFNQPPPLRNRAVCELWHTRSEAWSQKQQGSNNVNQRFMMIYDSILLKRLRMLSWRAPTYGIPLFHVFQVLKGFDFKLVASSPFFQAPPSPYHPWIWKWDNKINKQRKQLPEKVSWSKCFVSCKVQGLIEGLNVKPLKHIEVTKICEDSERFLLRLGQGHVRAFQLLLQRMVVGLQRWSEYAMAMCTAQRNLTWKLCCTSEA